MVIRIRQWKRSPNETDMVGIKETLTYVRRNMWTCRVLCVAPKIYSAKSDDSKIKNKDETDYFTFHGHL